MKGSWKGKVAMVLSLLMILTSFDVQASANSSIDKQKDSPVIATENLSVKGTNDIGELVEKAVAENKKEQDENNGNNIFSVEMREKTFVIDFETLQSCTMLLAIYSDDGKEMISSATTSVESEDSEVEIVIENVPEYFLIRAFLIDSETNQPLCTKYESPMYTKEMQDFLAKETGDFDEDKVLNLDDSETNNFVVYDENTQVIEETQDVNTLKEENADEQRYVFDNIDTKISSLQEGDILSYEQEDDNVLIVKVHTIDIDGDTAVITGEDTSMDEVFDYVKIDGTQDLGDAQIEESDEEEIQYEGLKRDNSDIIMRAVDFEGNTSLEASIKFNEDKEGEKPKPIKGSVKLGMTTSVKMYVSLSYQYLEMKIDYKLSNEVSLSGKVKGNIQLLKRVGFSPVPGVLIEFTPSFCVEGKASVSIKSTVKASVGFSVSSEGGFKNLTSSPKYDNTEIDGSVSVFVGLSLEPKVVVISETVAEAKMTATAGGVINATLEVYNSSPSGDKKHDCQNCIEGDISAKIVLGVGASFVSKLEINYSTEYQFKITDFYYSLDSKTWGWGTCPNKQYKLTVITRNPDGNTVSGARINDIYTTNSVGEVEIWLADGKYTITASKKDGDSVSKYVTMKGSAKRVSLKFTTNSGMDDVSTGDIGSGNISNPVEGAIVNPLAGKKIKDISFDGYTSIVTEDGDLYVLGTELRYTDIDFLIDTGMRTPHIPIKLLSNIDKYKAVYGEKGGYGGMALSKNGILYTWGGAGKTSKPSELLRNIKEMGVLGYGGLYAVDNEGNMYTWGSSFGTYKGQLGREPMEKDEESSWEDLNATKILSKVKEVIPFYYEDYCGAITENGDLYIWGKNQVEPNKIISNVKDALLGIGVVTNSGELYTWIEDDSPSLKKTEITDAKQIIDAAYEGQYYVLMENKELFRADKASGELLESEPLLSSVETIIVDTNIVGNSSYGGTAAALTEAGDVYMWGDNRMGLLGNGSNTYSEDNKIPRRVLSDVKEIDVNVERMLALTKTGDLFTWGRENYGGAGDVIQNSYVPTKCLTNVKKILDVGSCNAVVTIDGQLYVWGSNQTYKLGSKEYPVISTPYCLTGTEQLLLEMRPAKKHVLSGKRIITERQELRGLDSNSIYNVYVVKEDTEKLLDSENLLYVDQNITDSDGKLQVDWLDGFDTETVFVVRKLGKVAISDADVTLEDLSLKKEGLWLEPVVTYRGEVLSEGKDYEITGDIYAESVGTYTFSISGLNEYFGDRNVSATVFCSHEYGDWIVTEGGKERTCTICGNVEKQENTATAEPSANATQKPIAKSNPSAPSHNNHTSKVKKPAKVTGLNVRNKKKRKVVVSWNPKVDVSGYQIQYARNKSFTRAKRSILVGKWWTFKKVISNLKKNKIYYVRVRAYKKSSGKRIYGKWSKVKRIKVKK